MSPRSVRALFLATQLATVAMLMRSVALDRWITVAACLVLYGASTVGVRGRTWGLALAAVVGVTFLTIWTLGIAPGAFALVGLLALRPFARMFRHFLAFDRGAAMALAAGVGAVGAVAGAAWKAWAHALFAAIPALIPSIQPHHGLLVAALGAAGVLATLREHRSHRLAETSSSSGGTARIRIDAGGETESAALLEAEEVADEEEERARSAVSR